LDRYVETGFLLRDGVGHIPIILFLRTWQARVGTRRRATVL
jgi:hypothetical protein